MLEILTRRGHVAISGRKGRQRYWDLPDRVYPVDLPDYDLDRAVRQDVRFTKATTAAIRAEIEDLATWLGLEVTGS
jgi:uncharacterized protein YcaQ